MGKTGKWLKNFFTGKKDSTREKKFREKRAAAAPFADDFTTAATNENYPTTPISTPHPETPKEKSRWSFRRSSATTPRDSNATEATASAQLTPVLQTKSVGPEDQQKQKALAVAADTAAAAADAAVAAAQAAAAVIRLTAATATATPNIMEDAAVVKIQSVFRSYLARKALKALRGLVKLQALVRGHLVRKQAMATLRCMQTLVTLQAKVLAQRRTIEETTRPMIPTPPINRYSTPNSPSRHQTPGHYGGNNRFPEDNGKILEMDMGDFRESRKSTPGRTTDPLVSRPPPFDHHHHYHHHIGIPSPSTMSKLTHQMMLGSGHYYDNYNNYHKSPSATVHDRPQMMIFPDSAATSKYANESLSSFSYDYQLYPNYMANTQSSRAKTRSQSAPRQRPADVPPHFERQPSSRRRQSVEARSGVSIPMAVRMQRSSSNLSSTAAAQNFQYPWSLKLDRSAMSARDSECESVCTFLTSTEHCRSLVGFDVAGARKNKAIGPRY
ncbi:hypothetical protein SAY86_030791 [Trapa natans]|uniref:DUF4005 domain-containing protein n=1 Tax=Trapa natans TaxID=22666 RepID=A0AAN7M3F2_TRANT|nr:hypothetical protein SAY86_030791 [Trapa natans]